MDKKKKVMVIFNKIPATLMNAYFLGLPSRRNLANGMVDMVSNAMINALMVIYSGCLLIPMKEAMGCLKKIVSAVIMIVLMIRELRMVLYTSFSCSFFCMYLK